MISQAILYTQNFSHCLWTKTKNFLPEQQQKQTSSDAKNFSE